MAYGHRLYKYACAVHYIRSRLKVGMCFVSFQVTIVIQAVCIVKDTNKSSARYAS